MTIFKNTKYATVKDHSVSKEFFDLYCDHEKQLLYTHPVPDEVLLPKYYESDNYISHTDAKRTIFEKTYQIIKKITLKNKRTLINKAAPKKGILLDIGAGTGDFLAVVTTGGWNTIGVEPNQNAKKIAIEKGVKFVDSTSEIQNSSIDVITMWHVLEHVPNLENQISELKRMIKPNGIIIIAVPNYNSFDAKHYGPFWAAFDVPRHLWHFSKTSIQLLFQKQEIELQQILPMKFDAYYVSLLSEKYKTGKMNFITAFFIGFLSNWKAQSSLEYSSHIYVLKNQKNSI
jgi:2-polyprenyl-3-methyl-5-hydroxy-6-metoxy-1,4-benzoquinol methylase